MTFEATVYQVMIASPGDVQTERNLVRDVIAEWNGTHAASRGIVLLPVGWDTDAHPEMGEHPQAIINRQILDNSDILVAVFWSKLGTPTPTAESGTVEEIDRHLASQKPALLYFSARDIPQAQLTTREYERLKEFRAECDTRGLVREFRDGNDFRKLFRNDLDKQMARVARMPTTRTGAVEEISSDSPSEEAKELLRLAAESPDGHLQHIRHRGGEAYRAGETSIEPSSPRESATWQAAHEELQRSRLLASVSNTPGQVCRVTEAGYRLNDALTAKALEEAPPVNRGNMYWFPQDGVEHGPYCTRCWDVERKKVSLHGHKVNIGGGRTVDHRRCPSCDTNVVPP